MFAGLLTLHSALAPLDLVNPASIGSALSPFHRPDREGTWQAGPFWLMAQRVFNSHESHDEHVPCTCPKTGVALAFWGRLDNRTELCSHLGIDSKSRQDISDNQLLISAWQRWGESLPEQLVGDFAIAIADPAQQKIFLVRDAVGVKPLYYVLNDKVLAFATTVAALLKIESLSLKPDPEWIAHYLIGSSARSLKTAYQSVAKLPAGHCLSVDANGHQRMRQWFHFHDDAPTATKRDVRWVEAYREKFEEAVRCRMKSDYPLASENSGGLDSGSITSCVAHLLGEPGDRLYNMGVAFYETHPELILETSLMHKIVHNYIVSADDAIGNSDSAVQRSLQVLGFPAENYSGNSARIFHQACSERGIRTLFSGFGGDEVVTSSGGCLLRYEYLDSGQLQQLWNVLPGNLITRTLRLGKVAVTGRKRHQYNPTVLAAWKARWPHKLLRTDIADRYSTFDTYMLDATYDGPYRRINDFILGYYLSSPLLSARFESCTLMAASYGVEYRWPLWDTRLVQQYLSTPSYEKVGPRGIGRYLHRRAVDGIAPHEVTWNLSRDIPLLRQRAFEEIDISRIRWTTNLARQLDNNLHPLLDEFIDRKKFKEQIVYASQEPQNDAFSTAFQQNVHAIRRLNLWLHGNPET